MVEAAGNRHGEVAVLSVDIKGWLTPMSRLAGERESWTMVVAADFGGTSRTDILFYDASAGEADICFVDHKAGLVRTQAHTGWRKHWTHIVPGVYSEDPWSGLLFYDQASGDLEICRTDGLGRVLPLNRCPGWRPGWDIVTPGHLSPGAGTDLVFYDRDAGILATYTTDLRGNLVRLQTYTDQFWEWDHIVALSSTPVRPSDLLCYSRRQHLGRLYAARDRGKLKHVKTHEGWPRGWDLIAPMPVRGSDTRRVLFYDRSIGFAQLVDIDDSGDVRVVREYDDWKKTWCTIVPGHYTPDGVSDLLFYDRFADFVEADKARHALGCRYEVLDALDGPLGVPIQDLDRIATGWVRRFRRGEIYWRPDINANEVHGEIRKHYRRAGGPLGPLGLPISVPTRVRDSDLVYQSFDGGVLVWHPDGRVEMKDAVTFRIERLEQTLPIQDGPEIRRNAHNAELILRVTIRANGQCVEGFDDIRIPERGYMTGATDLDIGVRLPLKRGLRLEVVVRAFDVDLVGPDDYLGTWRMVYDYDTLVSRCLAGGDRVADAPIHAFEQKSDAVMGKDTLHLSYTLGWGTVP